MQLLFGFILFCLFCLHLFPLGSHELRGKVEWIFCCSDYPMKWLFFLIFGNERMFLLQWCSSSCSTKEEKQIYHTLGAIRRFTGEDCLLLARVDKNVPNLWIANLLYSELNGVLSWKELMPALEKSICLTYCFIVRNKSSSFIWDYLGNWQLRDGGESIGMGPLPPACAVSGVSWLITAQRVCRAHWDGRACTSECGTVRGNAPIWRAIHSLCVYTHTHRNVVVSFTNTFYYQILAFDFRIRRKSYHFE